MSGPDPFNYDEVPSGHYERIIWDASPVRTFWHQERFDKMADLIDSDPGSSLLDYGCASGSFLGCFRKPYGSAIGVDIAGPQVDLANKKYGNSKLRFVKANFRDLDLPPKSFDYIISSEVIEHIPRDDAKAMLCKFHDLLKDSGKLILSTPNYRSLWPVIEFFVNCFAGMEYQHQHVYKLDRRECERLLTECGFTVSNYSTMFVLSWFFAGFSRPLTKKWSDWEIKHMPQSGSLILLSASKKKN